MNLLEGLNEAQTEATLVDKGPLLILAGAGSGKTKTLTHRIAYLISERKVWPSHILAVTFTNKAAKEMRERLAGLLGEPNTRSFMPWMGTFHSICVRLLRMDGVAVNIPRTFVIYDEDDRRGLIKQVMRSLDISDKELKASAVSSEISGAKNALRDADEFETQARYPLEKKIAQIYREYEIRRRRAAALDFDDLLLEAVRLLRENKDIRDKWRQQFQYILIDEYQDTNAVQYQLVRLLVNDERNLCVVGDDWQSIYSWRGADFTNILNFERDFPGAKVVKLEQNYRSTGNILAAATAVIAKNTQRTNKKLWTADGAGEPVRVTGAYDDLEEARHVASHISAQIAIGARRPRDFAVLYRTNAQSLVLERAMIQLRVPYQIVGGVRFYDRKEIKDVLAYVKLLYQPHDTMSFSRIANVPTRGVGATSLSKFLLWQPTSGLDIIDALCQVETEAVVSGKARGALTALGKTLRELRQTIDTTAPAEIIERVIAKTGYKNYVMDGTPQAEEREENLGSLLNDAQTFASLPDFLEETSLMSSVDVENSDEKITMMTLHAAKGLEFPVVFMVGLEEGVLPHARVFNEGPSELEEERRLCYVGMTRAREELNLSYAYSRLQFGNRAYNPPSRFISDMGDTVMVENPEAELGAAAGGFTASFPSSPLSPENDDYFSDELGFSEGDRVRSAAFGDGEIIEIDGMAVTVAFLNGQTKKLNVEYAHLEKV